ncbi:hypothetical protein MKW92_049271 [Papaver armeniacum]|nr:hypothetical protein MKW92_049271 [Papaver armeniacum]
MLGRSIFSRSGSFRRKIWSNALAMIETYVLHCFSYIPTEDPLFHPSTKITNFLVSDSNATLCLITLLPRLVEDLVPFNQTDLTGVLNVTIISVTPCEKKDTVECEGPRHFSFDVTYAIEYFKDIHFYRFGKPVAGSNSTTSAGFYKDYAGLLFCGVECNFTVTGVGEYHTGVNARRRRGTEGNTAVAALPVFGEDVNDALQWLNPASFRRGKYLIYSGGGDRCKNMNHYLWSLLCSGDSIFDIDERGEDFNFISILKHLKESASDHMGLHLVEDFRVTPVKLSDVKDSDYEEVWVSGQDNYWYRGTKIEDEEEPLHVTNEPETSFFDPLKDKYTTHFLDDYKGLWDENSEWYSETTKLNVSVDTEVFLRGKTGETFNDLTSDCKDSVNTCSAST